MLCEKGKKDSLSPRGMPNVMLVADFSKQQ